MHNTFEESLIKNSKLPSSWQSKESRDELETFLQTNWSQRDSFYRDVHYESKQQFIEFRKDSIRTNNYVGTIVFKGEQINIFPKMFKVDKDDHDADDLSLSFLMRNLSIWIEYCNKIDYPYISFKGEIEHCDNLKELFIVVFIKYLKNAMERSAFYQYEEKTEDCSSIKGKFDVKDYFVKKIPNGNTNKFKCSFSEFVFDNLLNRIIKYTCNSILSDTCGRNQIELRKIISKLNDVFDIKCLPSDCDKIRLSRMNNHYKIIISMCKLFLLNKSTTYNVDKTDSFCFLFPTEVLFEGFIGGFIQSVVDHQTKVRLQASDMTLFDEIVHGQKAYGAAFVMRHDILLEKNKKIFILDTKYKELPRFNNSTKSEYISAINTGDLYQMYTYASRRGVNDVYLLYPLFKGEEIDEETKMLSSRVFGDLGKEQKMMVHVVRLPFVFEDDINKTKSKLKDVIDSLIS